MQSIRTLYKVGKGPSSSHTMGPERAAKLFREMTPEADRYEVILYGSLAKTGVGHGTDRVLVDTLAPYPTKIVFASVDPGNMKHPNTLDLIAYQDNKETQRIRVESIGGGDIVVEGEAQHADAEVYPENSFAEIARFCQWRHVSLPEYVELNEGPEIWSFLEHIWHVMRQSIEDGLAAEGILPGGLNVQRKAKYLYERTHLLDLPQVRELQLVCSYAFAVAEQNAGNGTIVTAPTCGSCGVLPAVLMYMQQKYDLPDRKIAEALGVAGLFGNLVRHNASISGAECGCQAEIGSGSGMAAGAICYIKGGDTDQIGHACAMALKNLMGLVCDPVGGLVEVPCVKRNVGGAVNALAAADMALAGITSKIPVDQVIDAMKEVGDKMDVSLRETGVGGVAGTPAAQEVVEKLGM